MLHNRQTLIVKLVTWVRRSKFNLIEGSGIEKRKEKDLHVTSCCRKTVTRRLNFQDKWIVKWCYWRWPKCKVKKNLTRFHLTFSANNLRIRSCPAGCRSVEVSLCHFLYLSLDFLIISLLVKRTPKSNGYRPECK